MHRIDENMVHCDGCGVEISWGPIRYGKRYYCCHDCRDGLPCPCGERMEIEDGRSRSTSLTSAMMPSIAEL